VRDRKEGGREGGGELQEGGKRSDDTRRRGSRECGEVRLFVEVWVRREENFVSRGFYMNLTSLSNSKSS